MPTCRDHSHCYTGEWSLHCGIAMLRVATFWYCYTEVLYIGIASLVSGHICWHWYTGECSLHVGIAILVSVSRCWYCYNEVLYIGIAILVSGAYILVFSGNANIKGPLASVAIPTSRNTHQSSNTNMYGSLASIAMPTYRNTHHYSNPNM
jgi:hypothetical protein